MANTELDQRRAILWHALNNISERAIKDGELRELLEPGASYKLQATITGSIGRAAVSESVAGSLNVGHDGVAKKSESPSAAHLLAAALQQMPKTKGTAFAEQIRAGALPDVTAEELEAASLLLERLRRQLPDAIRRGSVSFLPLTVVQEAA